MANEQDSFIDEVTEELRRDRLFQAFRRYGWIAGLVILLVVGGTGWREYQLLHQKRVAQEFGDAVFDAQDAEDPGAALAGVKAEGAGQKLVQEMLVAARLDDAGKPEEAAAHLREAAAGAKGANGPGGTVLLRDLALLKAVMGDPAMDLAQRDEALSQLSEPGAPFRLLALEQKAVALIGAGRDADAADLIRKIQEEDGLTEPMRRRLAGTLIVLGEAPADAAAGAVTLDDAGAVAVEND